MSLKSEFTLEAWVDTFKANPDSLGAGKMCLSHISDNGIKYQDIEYVDPLTKRKNVYQARIYTGIIKLKSSFSTSNNKLNVSIWF